MSRAMSAALIAQIVSGTWAPVLFFQSQWGDQTIYVWSGIGSISFLGQTWLGVGDFGSFSPIAETTDTAATGFSVSLSGVNPALISEALGQARRGLIGKIILTAFDATGNPVDSGYLSCGGRLDQPQIDGNPANCVITVTYESRLIDLERPRARRYDPNDQQIDFPTDHGFDFVAAIQNWNGQWGN